MEYIVEVGYLLGFYSQLLTKRQQLLLDAYYNQDLSLSEIAQQEQISRQGVHDAIRRGETELREFEEKLGLASRYKEILDKLKYIENKLNLSEHEQAKAALTELIQTWEE